MQQELQMPCGAHCICIGVSTEPVRMKTIQVALSLNEQTNGIEELFMIDLPETSTYSDLCAILSCRFAKIVRERGGRIATVGFELDGALRKKTWVRRLKQFWYEVTWRGEPAWFSNSVVVPSQRPISSPMGRR